MSPSDATTDVSAAWVRAYLARDGIHPHDAELDALAAAVSAGRAEADRLRRTTDAGDGTEGAVWPAGGSPEIAPPPDAAADAPAPHNPRPPHGNTGARTATATPGPASADDLATVLGCAAALAAGRISSAELVAELQRRADDADPKLGVYLARFDDQAREAARAADAERAGGTVRGPLHGIPLTVKDLILTREGPTTGHSAAPPRHLGGRDAASVARLRAAGAIVLGKVSLAEFGFGVPDADAGLPLPRNPWDTDRWPGGSSSGSAAGVAAGLFPGSIGTDTGGSIRIPAALCGVTGFKPTYGAVPTGGVLPGAPTVDTVGPIAADAADCLALYQVLAGLPASAPGDPATVRGLRIAVDLSGLDRPGADPAAGDAVEAAMRELADAGAVVHECAIPHLDVLEAACRIVQGAETYGSHRDGLAAHWPAYGSITRFFMAAGGGHDARDYLHAQRVRAWGRALLADFFADHDIVATPTVGTGAPSLDGELLSLLPLFYTSVWNATGFPAVSLPGPPDTRGLPLGIQLAAAPGADHRLLTAAHALQTRTDWHRRRPAGATAVS